MPAINMRNTTKDLAEINPVKAFEALVLVTLDAINTLRAKAGHPGTALIAKYKSL